MAIKKRNDKFEVGDLVEYIQTNGEFPQGTLGIVLGVDIQKSPTRYEQGIPVYFQRPSKWGHHENIIAPEYLNKIEEELVSAISSSGSIQTEMR
jgi:hypothetical protein